MVDVVIALLPSVGCAIWYHQGHGALVLGLSVLSCLLAGTLVKPGKLTWDNGVTGLILGLLLPPIMPPWGVVVGGFVAVLGVKCLFGGLGKNWMNPACAAAALVLLLVPQTPLRLVEGTLVAGYMQGSLGETSSLCLLIGGIYLVLRHLLSWEIVAPYFAFSFLTAASLPACNPVAVMAWAGTWLGAFFLTADPVTSPMGRGVRTYYCAGCGVATTYLAYHLSAIGGLCIGVLFMNVIGRLLELGKKASCKQL